MGRASPSSIHRTATGSKQPAEAAGALAADIERFRSRLADCEHPSSQSSFMATMQELLHYLGAYDDRETYAVFERMDPFASLRDFFGRCVLKFTWEMETITHRALMRARHDPSQAVGELVGTETRGAYERMKDLTELFDFASCQRYLMMGCGKVPGSLFYLHDWTDVAHLVGIERDPESLQMARDLVARFGLSRIEIEEGDAATIDYAGFEVINWDPFAVPRREIMERIVATASRPSTVILRDPFFTGTLLFEPMIDALDPSFEVVAESEGFPGRFMLKHYILRLER